MGYPFDRPLDKLLAEIVKANRNMMMLPLIIKRMDRATPTV
jgi:hypothetical protein